MALFVVWYFPWYFRAWCLTNNTCWLKAAAGRRLVFFFVDFRIFELAMLDYQRVAPTMIY
jgi:hypothetical protein